MDQFLTQMASMATSGRSELYSFLVFAERKTTKLRWYAVAFSKWHKEMVCV